jgi:hypothetical protein
LNQQLKLGDLTHLLGDECLPEDLPPVCKAAEEDKGIVQEQGVDKPRKRWYRNGILVNSRLLMKARRVGIISGVSSLSYLMGGWRFMIKGGTVMWYFDVLI